MPDLSKYSDQELQQMAGSNAPSAADPSQYSDSELAQMAAPQTGAASYQSPIADRQAGWGNVLPNLAADIPVVGGQIASTLTFPFARAYEATPMGGSQNPLRDVNKIPEIGKSIVDYYNNEYVQPLVKNALDDKLPWEHESVFEKHFTKAPLQTVMDTGLIPAEKALVGLSGKVVKGALATKAGVAATEALKTAGERSPIAKWYTENIIPTVKGELLPDSERLQYVKEALAQANRERLDNILTASKQLDKHWQNVPKDIRPYLTGVGEYTDRDLRRKFGTHPQVEKFLNVVRGYNRVMEKELAIPDDTNLRTLYGGHYLTALERQRRAALDAIKNELPTARGERLKYLEQHHEELRNPQKFEDLRAPHHMKALTKMKARMDKVGIQPPIYAALMTQAQLVAGLHKAMNKTLGGISKSKTGWAAREMQLKGLASVFHLPMKDWPGWLLERAKAHATELAMGKDAEGRMKTMESIRQSQTAWNKGAHSLNVKDLTLERMSRTYQFMAIRDFTRKLMEMKPEMKHGWVEVNLKEKFNNIAEQTGFDPLKIDALFKKLENETGIIHLPKEVADLVEDVLNGKEKDPGVIRLIDAINRTAKTALFTLDPTFGLRLALQTATLQAWMVKTPKQAMSMLLTPILALHPEAKNAIPDAIMLSHGTDRLKPKMLYAGLSYERMLNWLHLGLEAKNNFDYGINNWQRRSTALHLLLHGLENSPNQNVFADLLNMDRTLQTAKAMTFDPKILLQLQKQLTGYLGDYSADITHKGYVNWLASRVILVNAWVRHAGNIIKTIPMENPIKLSLLHALSQVASTTLQPPDMPKDVREQGFIKLAHENAYFRGWDLDSLRSGLDLLDTAVTLLWGHGNVEIPSKLSPVVTTPIELFGKVDMTHKDKKTGALRPFIDENPDITSRIKRTGKEYYTVPGNRHIKDIEPYTRPEIVARVANNMFTKQMNFINNMAEVKDGQPHVPSVYTYPGHPAPLRKHKQPIKKTWTQVQLEAIGMVLRKP
jgi:hypothetical protein